MSIKEIEFSSIVGMTFVSAQNIDNETVVFADVNGQRFTMFHEQDCCENVSVESIVGDLSDLIGSPILMAEEASQSSGNDDGSGTWTFYKLATIKGYVDIRWYGSSNGYYSESVSFVRSDS